MDVVANAKVQQVKVGMRNSRLSYSLNESMENNIFLFYIYALKNAISK